MLTHPTFLPHRPSRLWLRSRSPIRWLFLPGLAWAIVFSALTCSQAAEPPGKHTLDVLAMKAVPEGHYRVALEWSGKKQTVNIKVANNQGEFVRSSDPDLKGMKGGFQILGNGVFLASFANQMGRASQFWIFQPDGSATIKEIPDRGEKQTATPVATDSLEVDRTKRAN